jgi:hypothetical protein
VRLFFSVSALIGGVAFVAVLAKHSARGALHFLGSTFETFRARRGHRGARELMVMRARALIRGLRSPPGVLIVAAACAACGAPRGAPSANSSAVSSPQAPTVHAITPSPVTLDLTLVSAWPEPYQSDPLWTRAARGDALDRFTLAQREGAHGLMSALVLGGDLGRTALAALPEAPDRRDASAELCRLIAVARAPTRHWLLRALHELVMPSAAAPDADPDADAGCRATLLALARSSTLDASELDLATSALVYLDQGSTTAQ